ncbi:OmpA family protein [Geodermatophilus sp. SYSU D01176]
MVDHTRSQTPWELPPAVAAALQQAQQHQRTLVIIGVGSPGESALVGRRVPLDPEPGKDSAAARSAREIVLACVPIWASEPALLPGGEGSDQLAALAAAARQQPAEVLVVSDGVSSAPAMDLRLIGYDADPVGTASALATAGQLPQMADIKVLWTGLGETATVISEPGRTGLEQLWSAVLHAAGAAEVTIDSRFQAGGEPGADLPEDPMPSEEVVRLEGVADCFRLPNGVLFAGDSADLPSEEPLSDLATELAANPGWVAVVSGHTADYPTSYGSGGAAGRRELSQARAQAVVDALRRLGVPASVDLQAVGYGADRPVVDEWPGGVHDEGAAARNRRVDVVYGPADVVTTDTPCG